MISFKIRFDYNRISHAANVHKMTAQDNTPLQYIVVDVHPEIPNASPVYVYCPDRQVFPTSECNKPGEVPNEIIKAIKDYCIENNIPLT
jgi:hypothetical protein